MLCTGCIKDPPIILEVIFHIKTSKILSPQHMFGMLGVLSSRIFISFKYTFFLLGRRLDCTTLVLKAVKKRSFCYFTYVDSSQHHSLAVKSPILQVKVKMFLIQ